MSSGEMHTVLRHIRQMVGKTELGNRSDGQLLHQFIARRDETAFAALVQRHGPMVLGVCRRLLRNSYDAEDAFQATFLLLVRNARSISRPESVSSWLYGVAYKTAARARADATRRAILQRPLGNFPARDTGKVTLSDLGKVLDQELQRLPKKYRDPMVLHYLEGKTKNETARLLGWTEGTVSGRLARARNLLRGRLNRQGMALSLASVLSALAPGAQATVPEPLMDTTVQAATAVLLGKPAGSAAVAALMEGVRKAMLMSKLKTIVAGFLAVALVATGVSLFAYPTSAEEPPQGKQDATAKEKEAKSDLEKLLGPWDVVGAERDGRLVAQEEIDRLKLVRFTFSGDKLLLEAADEKRAVKFELEPSRDLKWIRLTPVGIPGGEIKEGGLYFLQGDSLKLCLNHLQLVEDLVDVNTHADSSLVLLHLKRGKPTKDVDKAQAEASRELVTKNRSRQNLKTIAVAMHNFHDANGAFPAAAIYNGNGKPILSWRVAILPYIDEDKLYKEFKMDEPWDSPHNKKLLGRMPKVYAPNALKPKENTTYYQVFTGIGSAFEGVKGIRIPDITDGSSNTIMVVEAGEPVPWTKPDDLPYSADKKLPALGGLYKDGFHAAFCDGSVRFLKRNVNEQTLRAFITRNGGEVIMLDP